MNFATMRSAAALALAAVLSSTIVASAQTAAGSRAAAARNRTAVRGVLINRQVSPPMGNTAPFAFTAQPMHQLPEQGTLREIVGIDRVTGVNGSLLTLRASSGAMAAIRMPAARIRAMRLRGGSLVRFEMLSAQRFKLTTAVHPRRIK